MQINGYNMKINERIKEILEDYPTNYLPKRDQVFRSLEITPFNDVKIVILGQDPYPNIQDACGLSFSVDRDFDLPKSLVNIFIELEKDLDVKRKNGDLSDWAKQGVLLLNTILTVEQNKSNSHKDIGWYETTLDIITQLSNRGKVIFVLLGRYAQKYESSIDGSTNTIIKESH
ncbi:MAG: uracil-DNA glycosylase, partial [Mycoplasmatales bacterium]